MKKLLAILMTVALLVSVCCFGVSADRVVGNSNGTIDDGVASFDPKTAEGILELILKGQASRYAVDVEFGTLQFEYGGENIWDVNTYEYVFSSDVAAPTVQTTVSVVNHSDERVAVEITPQVSDFLNEIAMISLTNITANANHTVDPAISNHIYTCKLIGVPETAVNVEAYTEVRTTVEATFEPYKTLNETKTWADDVLPAIQENIVDGKVTLGTITVKVSMVS